MLVAAAPGCGNSGIQRRARISSIDKLENVNGEWVTKRRLNGDQSGQGRALLMAPHQFGVYRVKLYTLSR